MTGRFLFGFGCAVFLGCALSAAEYFVSPAGSDAAAGTREAPFGTIARAMAGMSQGDIVTLLPGVYFEFVRFSGAGDAARPLTLRAEKPRTVIVTGAHREIREKRRAWRAAAPEIGLYEIDYDLPQPSRVLYDNVDLFPYKSPEELKSFTIRRGTVNFPGPRHGFAVDSRAGKLYVRLRPDGRYGDPDPNCHVMAVSPAPTTKYGPRYSLSASDSLACNLLLFRPGAGSMHLIVDGIDFETPGRAAISMMASDVTVRNCRFQGCWRGGIERVGDAERIVLENSEWHCFPIFDDVRELLMTPEAGKNSEVAWPHKSAFRGAVVPYETGICTKVGKDWIIRGNYIHDCFDALCGLGYSGVNVRIENNRFARCIDNAVELEDHGKNIVISGNLFEDSYFEQNLRGAYAAGLECGVYFFSQAVTVEEAEQEADFVLELLQKVPECRLSYPVAYDMEASADPDARTADPSITNQLRTDMASAFCNKIKDAGYITCIYSNKNWFEEKLDLQTLRNQYDLWVAHWTQELTPFTPFTQWQYTSEGSVAGINGAVDRNICTFDYARHQTDSITYHEWSPIY